MVMMIYLFSSQLSFLLYKLTAMLWACEGGRLSVVEYLVEQQGVIVNNKSGYVRHNLLIVC